MVNHPNIKAEILQYVIEDESWGSSNLRKFADENDYSRRRVGIKSSELSDVLECGVPPMFPWIRNGKEDKAREKLRNWGYDY